MQHRQKINSTYNQWQKPYFWTNNNNEIVKSMNFQEQRRNLLAHESTESRWRQVAWSTTPATSIPSPPYCIMWSGKKNFTTSKITHGLCVNKKETLSKVVSTYQVVTIIHFSLCVTLASATPKAWTAVNGYWKSSVYALLSIRPNCITWKRSLKLAANARYNFALFCCPVCPLCP